MELELGDVQTTALIPLVIKANETLRPNARIKDPKAVEIIQKLKKIYNDDDELIKKTYKYFVKRFNAISKHATEFKRKLMSVYQYYDLTKIMKKASEYAAKYNMTPAEYHLFINLVKISACGDVANCSYYLQLCRSFID